MSFQKEAKKIIVYSHDTFGLGNIRRMLAICKHIVDTDPNASVLILSGSPMLHAFRIPPRIDYIKLPCLSRNTSGSYGVKFLNADYDEIVRLRSNIILSVVLDFDPDLIIVDKKPLGVSDELGTALDLLQRRGHRAKLVLLLRDILDTPPATIKVWQKNGYHDAIRSFYDKVLIVGSPDIFNTSREYQFPEDSEHKVEYCGYIARQMGTLSGDELRQDLGLVDTDHLVLVTAGGGEDGAHLLSTYLRGLCERPVNESRKSLVICGPEMTAEQRSALTAVAEQRPDVVIQEFAQDMMACMDAADVVVSMGGYNTVCELLTLKKRAVIVPRVSPVKEQWIRAERLARLGLLRAIHPGQLTPVALMETIDEELERTNIHCSRMYQIDMGGLPRISRSVTNLLYGTSARTAPAARQPMRGAPAE